MSYAILSIISFKTDRKTQFMERNIITIEADQLPSKKLAIGLVEPTFRDRRDAAKRIPVNADARVGYSLEQLLLSMSIVQINGRQLREDPRDPICNIRYLKPEDSQYLLTAFLEAFTLTEELSAEVKQLSQTLKDLHTPTYTIPKDRLPNELFSVTFKSPTTGDQIDIDRRYPGADAGCGFSSEEMLFAACITAIDGKQVETPKDIISLCDSWPHIDFQYCMGVFLNLVFIDREQRHDAQSLGKQLRRKKETEDFSTVKSADSTTAKPKATKEPVSASGTT